MEENVPKLFPTVVWRSMEGKIQEGLSISVFDAWLMTNGTKASERRSDLDRLTETCTGDSRFVKMMILCKQIIHKW